jgi:2-polyprenyl-3-methyl-5-hydroxy-6-metoxy-1,4-benzoquinol methylase
MTTPTTPQQRQEDQYSFPYHYLDLCLERFRVLDNAWYLTKLEAVRELLGPLEGRRLLDAGCGDGRLCYELAGQGVSVVGIDSSAKAIAFAKAFSPGVEFRIADLTQLQSRDEFDVITLIDVLEHFAPDVLPVVVANLYRALKPGGRLLVSVPTVNKRFSEKHYQHFTVERLEAVLVPPFTLVVSRGLERSGMRWRVYRCLLNAARFVWPLRGSVPGVRALARLVQRYYDRRVRYCSPAQARTIIEVFEKRA